MDLEDRIAIATPEGVELELQLAGLGSRFIAALVDSIIQGVMVIVLVVVTGVLSGGTPGLDALAFAIGAFLALFAYPIAFEVLNRGRTPGKALTHLRVVRDTGAAVDLPASAIRNFMRLIDGALLFYLPTAIFILATKRNQRPGDLVAGTLVVREPPVRGRPPVSADLAPNVAGAAVAAGWQQPPGAGWDVSAISDADLAAVRQFLARRQTLDGPAREALARRLADGLAAKLAGEPFVGSAEQFLEVLVQVKSARRSAEDS